MRYLPLMLLTLFICVSVISCGTPANSGYPPYSEGGWTWVASLWPIENITYLHVRNLLKSHGIAIVHAGRAVYVPNKDARRSLEILREDLKTRKYEIKLRDGEREEEFIVPDEFMDNSSSRNEA